MFVGAYFLAIPRTDVEAQAPCAISTAVGYRTYKAGGNFSDDDNFYESDDRPIVYFDIQTSGCIGQTIKLTLFDFDDVDAISNLPVIVGTNTNNEPNFTLAARAGEENCTGIINQDDCDYVFKVKNNSGAEIYSSVAHLNYECENNCDVVGEDWEYLDIIPFNNDLGGTGGLDPYGPGNISGNTTVAPPPTPGDTPGGVSVIDLSIDNPLAGTIGTIPEFLHMIVNFIIKISIPLIAMAIVYSGFLFVSARGSDDQLKHAKEVFTYTIIGGLVLMAAWVVAEAIKDALLSI